MVLLNIARPLILALTVMVFVLICFPLSAKAAASPVVVVIDPGHGGPGSIDEQDLGATYHNQNEKELTLRTAIAMRDELSLYKGIEVYLTRTDDVAMSLSERAQFAADKGADVLISIHYNASEYHQFYGSEVWVSAYDEFYNKGYALGTFFVEQRNKEGFVNRGIKTKLGKHGDYYGIIREARKREITGIIVEHAHMDQDNDWNKIFMESEQMKLGIDDATAVANYYGLSKTVEPQEIITPALTIEAPAMVMKGDTSDPYNPVVTINKISACGSVLLDVSAQDDESELLYYAVSTDGGETFSDLYLMNQHMIWLDSDRDKQIIVRIFNNYNCYCDSNPVAITWPAPATKQIEDVIVNLEGHFIT